MNKINPKETALLVVDVQNFYLEEGAPLELPSARTMIPALNSLVTELKDKGSLIIYTRQRHDNFNNNIYKELFPDHFTKDGKALLADGSHWFQVYPKLVNLQDHFIDKDRWSAFYQTNLEMLLRDNRIKNVVITGLATNVCCESTARDAFFRDFNVLFLSDCNVTLDDEMHNATLKTISLAFGKVLSKDELLKTV